LQSLFFLFFLSFSLVSFACYLVCCLFNKLADALQINVFLIAKATRSERQNGFAGIVQDLGKSANRVHKKPHCAGWKPRCDSFSFSALTAFRSLGAANQHGSGGKFGFGPERPGPQGPGGTPPLASFTGLRSRSLIVFFFLSFILVLL
jgi:hypothetical protein